MVELRDIRYSDLETLYRQQNDPEANRMADFPARNRSDFLKHWNKILENPHIIKNAILFEEKIAGNIVCFEMDRLQQIGYWMGKNFWAKGIATFALQQFLKEINIRPLFACVSIKNIASIRVLEKCGVNKITDKIKRPVTSIQIIMKSYTRLKSNENFVVNSWSEQSFKPTPGPSLSQVLGTKEGRSENTITHPRPLPACVQGGGKSTCQRCVISRRLFDT